ncbi:MAG: type II toxin-antitoxin system VapC family toxin [Anaerolineae bacterium]|nr:type II toxin-antitoxin system VapC family toxin [Anaerolineae bacterium]
MKLLLDTHTFIWWDSDPAKLSTQVLALCNDPANTLLLSVASVWEMQIKAQLGKLTFARPLTDLISQQQQTNHLQVLDVSLSHVLALDGLPTVHKDPFDRLLIAQANIEGAALLSRDPVFAEYPVSCLW